MVGRGMRLSRKFSHFVSHRVSFPPSIVYHRALQLKMEIQAHPDQRIWCEFCTALWEHSVVVTNLKKEDSTQTWKRWYVTNSNETTWWIVHKKLWPSWSCNWAEWNSCLRSPYENENCLCNTSASWGMNNAFGIESTLLPTYNGECNPW